MSHLFKTLGCFTSSKHESLGMPDVDIWAPCLVNLDPDKIFLVRMAINEDGELNDEETSILFLDGNFLKVKEKLDTIINHITPA